MASIILNSVSCALAVVTGSTQSIKVHTSTLNVNAGVFTPACVNNVITTATTTTICAGPSA